MAIEWLCVFLRLIGDKMHDYAKLGWYCDGQIVNEDLR